MMAVTAECWRVLRDDGTMWLNINDTYLTGSGGSNTNSEKQKSNRVSLLGRKKPEGTKAKDLAMIPARLALAMQAQGWYVRSQIIWHKPNCMPGSQKDRPTSSYEMIYLCAKQPRYFFDWFAIREPASAESAARLLRGVGDDHKYANGAEGQSRQTLSKPRKNAGGGYSKKYAESQPAHGGDSERHDNGYRMKRDVWTFSTQGYNGAHYATFPEALPEICILAGTSAHGVCPECGAPFTRITKTVGGNGKSWHDHESDDVLGQRGAALPDGYDVRHVGWKPSCDCGSDHVIPARVFDPFVGSGTTVKVAKRFGRRGLGTDLSLKYLRENALPRAMNTNTAEAMRGLPLLAGVQ
jgi:DNA modification methylase